MEGNVEGGGDGGVDGGVDVGAVGREVSLPPFS